MIGGEDVEWRSPCRITFRATDISDEIFRNFVEFFKRKAEKKYAQEKLNMEYLPEGENHEAEIERYFRDIASNSVVYCHVRFDDTSLIQGTGPAKYLYALFDLPEPPALFEPPAPMPPAPFGSAVLGHELWKFRQRYINTRLEYSMFAPPGNIEIDKEEFTKWLKEHRNV